MASTTHSNPPTIATTSTTTSTTTLPLPSGPTSQAHPHPLPTPSTSSLGLRLPSTRRTIYDRHLSRTRTAELSHAAFAFLFAESIIYAQRRVTGIQELEARLAAQGRGLGGKVLDLILYRALPGGGGGAGSAGGGGTGGGSSGNLSSSSSGGVGPPLRPLRILPLLTLLTTRLYPLLFSRPADSLEQSTTNPAEYMIIDNTPLTNAFVSVPKEMSQLSVAAWTAGVVEGVCSAAGFAVKVSAHNHATEQWPLRTVFLVRFEDGVLEREAGLERAGVR